ncbi:MAG: shikimate dehydrogenase family protein [Bacteroidota bacterium]|jgi:shikimate dehydrogenase
MRKFGLIGLPLTHSFSKQFFTEKFEKEQITDCQYENYPLEKIEDLPALLAANRDIVGLNVTIPYKREIMPFLTDVAPAVKKTGACNCIRIDGKKRVGYNTDVIGFHLSLMPHLRVQHQRALILGTGGASAAVEFVLQQIAMPYILVSRNPGTNSIGYDQLNEDLMESHTLIVNTTPLGTFPAVETYPPIPYEYVTDQHFLYDMVYNPAETIFLQRGKEKGATVLNGMDMLIGQANASWDIWKS